MGVERRVCESCWVAGVWRERECTESELDGGEEKEKEKGHIFAAPR